jgi:hypothetical protein
MLEQILRALGEGRLLSIDELAKRLDVTHPMVEAMMRDLERMGYLKALQPACDRHCAGCSSDSICTIIGGAHIWSLSEKGQLAISRLHAAGNVKPA